MKPPRRPAAPRRLPHVPAAPAAPRERPSPPSIIPNPAPRPRGGRRPGAGAPKGNTNAVKHGLFSRRLHVVASALAASPDFAALERALVLKTRDRKAARQMAIVAVILLLHRTRPQGFGRLSYDQLVGLAAAFSQGTIDKTAPSADSVGPLNRDPARSQSHNQSLS